MFLLVHVFNSPTALPNNMLHCYIYLKMGYTIVHFRVKLDNDQMVAWEVGGSPHHCIHVCMQMEVATSYLSTDASQYWVVIAGVAPRDLAQARSPVNNPP